MNNLNKLEVGAQVGVARMGSWEIQSEGIFTVVKVDKVKVVVKRESDGYERCFNIKTNAERGKGKFRSAFIESVAAQIARNEEQCAKRNADAAWRDLESAVRYKSLEKAEAALAVIKSSGKIGRAI